MKNMKLMYLGDIHGNFNLIHQYVKKYDIMILSGGFDPVHKGHLEMIDEAVLWLGMVEIRANELPHPIVMDECIRLSKKFSNPNSFKFINAKLDEWLKTNQSDWLKKSN